jgi:hypothetical protein
VGSSELARVPRIASWQVSGLVWEPTYPDSIGSLANSLTSFTVSGLTVITLSIRRTMYSLPSVEVLERVRHSAAYPIDPILKSETMQAMACESGL